MRPISSSYRDFTGGQNDRYSNMTIDPKEAVVAQNFFGDEVMGLSCQPFARNVGSLPSGTGWNGLWVYEQLTTNQKSLIAANVNGVSSGYFTSPDGKTWTQATDAIGNALVYNFQNIPEGVSFQGKFWLTNGNDPVLVYDGADWLRVRSPRVFPDIAAGLLSAGIYKWQVTFTLDGIEYISQVDSFSLTLTANQKVDLTKIPLGPPDATSRNIYRTKANGSIYYLLPPISGTVLIPPNTGTNYNTLPDNSTVSYIDNTPDSSLVTALVTTPDSTHVLCPIPKGFYPVIHQNRLWMIKTPGVPNGAYFSEVDEPDYFPPDSNGGSVLIVPTEGDIIWGAKPFNEKLVIVTEHALWTLYGNNVFAQFELDKTLSNIGSLYHRSLQVIYLMGQQLLMLLGKLGFYLFDGTTNPLWISKNISNAFANLQQPNITFGDAIYDSSATFGTGTYSSTADYDNTLGGVALVEDTVGTALDRPINFTNVVRNMQVHQTSFAPANGTGGTNCGLIDGMYNTFWPGTNVFIFSVGNYYDCKGASGNWNVMANFTPIEADHINYTHRETGDYNRFSPAYYRVTIYDIYGNVVAGVNIPYGVSGILETVTIPFTKTKIGSIFIEAAVESTSLQSGSPLEFRWEILPGTTTYPNEPSMSYNVLTYENPGTWTSPVINTGSAEFKQWKNLLTTDVLNGQQLIYSIRSGPAGHATPDSSWSAWSDLANGDQILLTPTDQYAQLMITLSLTSTATPLSAQSTAQTYPALTFPEAPISANNPYPFIPSGDTTGYSIATDTDQEGNQISTLLINGTTQPSWDRGSTYPTTLSWTPFVNATGETAEIRVKINNCPNGMYLQLSDDTRQVTLLLKNTFAKLSSIGVSDTVSITLNDGEYHIYRVTLKGNLAYVYMDNSTAPILTITTTSATTFGNLIELGTIDNTEALQINYLSWDATGAYSPLAEDTSSSPVCQSLFISWLASSTSLFPTNNVCSTFFLNRYWFAGLELTSSGITTNNVFYILDTNGRWFFRRGNHTPANAAVMVIYEEQLWWGDSNNTNLWLLDDKARQQIFDVDIDLTVGDISTYLMKKDDLNAANREKLFRTLYIKYKASSPFSIIAYVDDTKMTSWLIPASTTENTVVVNFKPDGTQIGTHLQLEIFNTPVQTKKGVVQLPKGKVVPTGTNTLTDLEIYEIKVLAKVFEPRLAVQMGTTVQ